MDTITKLIDRVETALDLAKQEKTKLTDTQFAVMGLSGRKFRIFLNELIKPETRYLEVGAFTGSTFISAMYGNNPQSAIVVDSFAPEHSWNMDMKIEIDYYGAVVKNGLIIHFLENCMKNNVDNFMCIQGDCFNLLFPDKFEIRDVDTYFFDAGHTKEDHIKAITYYINNLADTFIYIVDDWNDETVREGTKAAFDASFVRTLKEWEFFSTVVDEDLMDGDKKIGRKRTYDRDWWNGYYIAVCQKPMQLTAPEDVDIKNAWGLIKDTVR